MPSNDQDCRSPGRFSSSSCFSFEDLALNQVGATISMDQQLLQRTRYLLQARFRRMKKAPAGQFENVAKQVLEWAERHPILGGIIYRLDNIPGDHHDEIVNLMKNNELDGYHYHQIIAPWKKDSTSDSIYKGYTSTNWEEHTSACLAVIRASIEKPEDSFYQMLAIFLTKEEYSIRHSENDPLDAIKDIAVNDLYEFLDETLDSVNAVNGLLHKYKQSVEWFQRDRLHIIIETGYEGRSGERGLALHLQQYVFDQGIEFSIEPTSASGEADLVLRDVSGQYTIIDAKYIASDSPPSTVKKKIAEGLNQVSRYCNDFNQFEGFLAVFVDDDIAIQIEIDQTDGYRYVKVGGHIIYYIEINISQRPSASKSGKAKQISISKAELFHNIAELSSDS